MRHRLFINQMMAAALMSLACLVAVFLLCEFCPRDNSRVYSIPSSAPADFDLSGSLPEGGIDPNTADMEAFLIIPGIGEKTAAAIIAEREMNGPFFFPEDLLAVKGIGEKKLEAIRPFLVFTSRDGE